jgi:hypothetical protein
MSVLPELERQLVRAAGGGSPGPRRPLAWASVAIACAVVGLVVIVFTAVGSRRAAPGVAPAPKPAPGPTVPASWAQACAQTGDCEPVPSGRVPSALRRPFPVPALRPGQSCPSMPARRFTTSYVGGIELGSGPVRADIGDRVDVPNGRIVLGITGVQGWFGIKTVWYSVPAYDGPWSVRAVRLSGNGRIDLANVPAPPARRGPGFSATALDAMRGRSTD